MSKANYGTNSSGTGSFPNVITVNMITVQMNVNSSTINVQVEYCVYTVTQQAPNLSLSRGCDVAVSPQLFVFLFLIISGHCHQLYATAGLKSTTLNLEQRMKQCK